jgi:prepilin-type processing-associated H-X9-DG protein
MAFSKVFCSDCGKEYRIAAAEVDRRVKCKACGHTFVIPAASDEPQPLDPGDFNLDISEPPPPRQYGTAVRQDSAQPFQAPNQGVKRNLFAIYSLAFSCVICCVPFSGIVGIIFGIFGLNEAERIGRGRQMSIAGIVLGSFMTFVPGLFILLSILIPSLHRAYETAQRVKCAANLRSIGAALIQYSKDYGGVLPPDLNSLVQTNYLTKPTLICPDDSDTTLNDRPDGSYIYLCPGQRPGSIRLDQAVVYEPVSLHVGGSNVLYGDWHVEFDSLATVAQLPSAAPNPPASSGSSWAAPRFSWPAPAPNPRSSPSAQSQAPWRQPFNFNSQPSDSNGLSAQRPFPGGGAPGFPQNRAFWMSGNNQDDLMQMPSKAESDEQLRQIAGQWHQKSDGAVDLMPLLQGDASRDADGVIDLGFGQSVRTVKTFQPPVTFQIVLITNEHDTRVGYAADQIIFNWEMDHNQLRVDGGPASGKYKPGVGELPQNQWVGIELTVKRDAMIIDIAGKEIYNVDGDFSSIDQAFSIEAHNGPLKLKSVKMIPNPTQ